MEQCSANDGPEYAIASALADEIRSIGILVASKNGKLHFVFHKVTSHAVARYTCINASIVYRSLNPDDYHVLSLNNPNVIETFLRHVRRDAERAVSVPGKQDERTGAVQRRDRSVPAA